METVFPCRSPKELPRDDEPKSDTMFVPVPPPLLLDIHSEGCQGVSSLRHEANSHVSLPHVYRQSLNNNSMPHVVFNQSLNNSSATTVFESKVENATVAAGSAAVFSRPQLSNDSSSAPPAGTLGASTAVYGDAQVSEVKSSPSPKRRRVLDRCEVEADGLQFLNSYCLALATDTFEKSVDFCQKLGLLPQKKPCPSCNDTLSQVYYVKKKNKRSTGRFQCNKRRCKLSGKNTSSVKEKSWFQNSNLSYRKNLIIMKCFVDGVEVSSAIRESSVPEENAKGEICTAITSCESVVDMYAACREVCALSLLKLSAKSEIGGQSKTVELGESCFERFKHINTVQNCWLLGGICRETDKIFVDVVPNRDPQAALACVGKHVKKGTHIITQCSALIQCSSELLQQGYLYSTGEAEALQKAASKKNSETKHWQSVRKHFPFARITGGVFALHLAELLWRRGHRQDRDPFRSFIGDITQIYEF